MCFRRDEAWKSLFNYLNGRALLDRREVRQGRSRMHVVHDFNKDRNRLVKTMHVRKATVHVQKEQVRNVHTLARSARGKALLPARCALHSQTCSSLAKLLPGNLWRRMHAMQPSDDRHREEKGHSQEQTKGRTSRTKKKNRIDRLPLAWPEGVGHGDDVVPLGVPEVLRRQRAGRPRRRSAAVALARQEGLVELPELVAPLHDELVGCQLHGVGDLPRLHLAVVEPVRPRQHPATTIFYLMSFSTALHPSLNTVLRSSVVVCDPRPQGHWFREPQCGEREGACSHGRLL
jgi:hypothetical protein